VRSGAGKGKKKREGEGGGGLSAGGKVNTKGKGIKTEE